VNGAPLPCIYLVCLLVVVSSAFGQSVEAGAVYLSATFDEDLKRWRPQGEGFSAALVASDRDGGKMARLDNSDSDKNAFLGVQAGPVGKALCFSVLAKSAGPEGCKIGLHRYAGPIAWSEVGDTWQKVTARLTSHAEVPSWYIVVPPRSVVLVDNAQLTQMVMTSKEREARLAVLRIQARDKAVAALQASELVLPLPDPWQGVWGQFPVGFFTVRRTSDRKISLEEILGELSDCGVNFAHNSDFEDWPEHTARYEALNSNGVAEGYLDTAQRRGIGVMMAFDRMMAMRADLASIRTRVSALRGHAALRAWYLMDEPDIHGARPEDLQKVYGAIKELDPEHPVVMTISDHERIGEYESACDVVMVDTYPISPYPPICVAPAIERALEQTEGRKPVWSAVQVHNNDLHHVLRGDELASLIDPPRPPTLAEVRCMTFLSLAHGASGIIFYAYDAWKYGKVYDDPALYKGIRELAGEVAQLSPALLRACMARGIQPGRDGTLVSYIVRGGATEDELLIAANGFDRATGPVELPIGPDRTVTVELEPYGTLVAKAADLLP